MKADAKLWGSHLKIAQRGDIQILLAEADSIKRDLTHMEAACFDLQKQVKGLQESRRELLAQMHQMVPRSDLLNAQAEVATLRASIVGLQREAAAAQQDKERLVTIMQVNGLFST
jgi:hypothetical protein